MRLPKSTLKLQKGLEHNWKGKGNGLPSHHFWRRGLLVLDKVLLLRVGLWDVLFDMFVGDVSGHSPTKIAPQLRLEDWLCEGGRPYFSRVVVEVQVKLDHYLHVSKRVKHKKWFEASPPSLFRWIHPTPGFNQNLEKWVSLGFSSVRRFPYHFPNHPHPPKNVREILVSATYLFLHQRTPWCPGKATNRMEWTVQDGW